jgi:hypothetical protein
MNHVQPKPFPWLTSNGKLIIGELCHCGHFRSEHHDTIAYGHGKCGQCKCVKYTWKAMVFGTRKETLAAVAKAAQELEAQ